MYRLVSIFLISFLVLSSINNITFANFRHPASFNESTPDPEARNQRIINPAPSGNHAVLDSKYILGNVNFPSDATGDYYITIRHNFVKIKNGQLYILGKMEATENADYPYILTGARKHPLFIDRYGKIMNAQKQVTGYLKIV